MDVTPVGRPASGRSGDGAFEAGTVATGAHHAALDPLLTVDDVGALLRLSPKSVYKLVDEGKLPGVRRIGRRVRFYRPELVAWIAGQESARPRRSR